MKVGVIGLGVMGAAMAKHLSTAGLLAGVWNRTASRGQPIAERLDTHFADSPAELATHCDVLLTCVSADPDLVEVVDALMPALTDRHVLVDTSTIGVETVTGLAARLADVGAGFIDAPVTGGAEGAEAGTLQVMAGGDAASLEQVRPALQAFSSGITHFGAVGAGQQAKAVNQVLVAGIVQAISEALAFADASGLDTKQLIPVLCSGAAGCRLLERRGERVIAGDFVPGFRMALHHKDLRICQDLLRSMDMNLPTVEMTLKHYDRLMSEGHGDEDITALYRFKRALFESGNRKSL
ncbi:NAD-binding protein [Spiribacter sp. 2438]|uniref:NAD(P)-dependent oxidoreductase n=1 Tax=Spiribacter sp. 2438 TaxID=2666185 RepID=UPI0012AF0678|nr:NAD-binding protein [Spiribacter sp. 2438]